MCGLNVKELSNKTPRYFELLTVVISGTKLDFMVLNLIFIVRIL